MTQPKAFGRLVPRNDSEVRENSRLRTAKWRATHAERAKALSQANWTKWSMAHPGPRIDIWAKARAAHKDARAKAIRLGLAPGGLTKYDFARLQLLPCHYCGVMPALSQDHVVPFIRGGANDLHNLVPSCPTCNREKAAA